MITNDRLGAVVAGALTAGLWLSGRASTDALLQAGGFLDRAADPLAELARLRRSGATHAWVAAGRAGRPDPLSGAEPAIVFSAAPGESGRDPALLVALLRPREGLRELALPADPLTPPPDTLGLLSSALTPAQANRELRELLRQTSAQLEPLELQRSRADLARALARAIPPVSYPAGLDARLLEVLDRADHIRAIAVVALADDGAAVTAAEAAERGRPLRELAAQAGDVLAAAANGNNLV
ncbi:MAG: hypothetical protein ACOYEV_08280 [Candidatus Nanopelagicales bacterium]